MADQVLRLTLTAAALLLGTAAPAAAATPVQAAAVAFGLPGDWAADCSKPASLENGYEHWSLAADGTVVEVTDAGAGYQPNTYRWTDGALAGANEIRLDGVYLRDNEPNHDVMRKINGELQTWQAEGGGRKLVTDGRVPIYVRVSNPNAPAGQASSQIVDTGQTRETPRVHRCEGVSPG